MTFLTVAELGRAYRSGGVSPVDVVEACLEAIQAFEPDLNAWITVLADSARDAARSAEVELTRGTDRGPLHGIPVAVKDNMDLAGTPTTGGSRKTSRAVARRDADVVARLRHAGAIVVGKTNLLEFAYGAVHPDRGQCNNPWNVQRTSGGSSSGSAAAVAAGLVPLALGTDTGGSIRIPASYCGIVGLKPTYGRVSCEGVIPLSWSLDHVGPMARTVADVSLALAVLDGRGSQTGQVSDRIDLRGLRVGVCPDHDGPDLLPEVREAFERALGAFTGAGAARTEVSLPALADCDSALLAVIAPEASLVHEQAMRTRPGDFAPTTREQLEVGARLTAVDYLRAQRWRSTLREQFAAAFERCDVIASPTVAWGAPREDPPMGDSRGEIEARRTAPYNLAGLPAVTIPCGTDSDGLPLGLQLAAATGADQRLLAIAEAAESALGWDPTALAQAPDGVVARAARERRRCG